MVQHASSSIVVTPSPNHPATAATARGRVIGSHCGGVTPLRAADARPRGPTPYVTALTAVFIGLIRHAH